MKDNIDLKVLRILPYAVFTMFISIMFSMAGLIVRIITSGSVSDSALYQMDSNIYMICYFIMYVAVVLIMSFLYEMSNISKWFGYACTTTLVFILSETVDFVVRWAVRYIDNYMIKMALVVISEIIPSLCIVFLVIFILHGMIELYMLMDKEKKALKCKRFRVYCIIAFAFQILLSALASASNQNNRIFIFFIVTAGAIYIFNLIIIYFLYGRIKTFCYDFYLYSYNSGR